MTHMNTTWSEELDDQSGLQLASRSETDNIVERGLVDGDRSVQIDREAEEQYTEIWIHFLIAETRAEIRNYTG